MAAAIPNILNGHSDYILVCPCRGPRGHPPIEEQVRLAVLALLPAENVLLAQVRDQLVVDADPCRPRAVGELAVGMKDVEGVMAAMCRRSVVV